MNARASRIQKLMACLGDPSRFRIVQVLAARERYVMELADLIGLSQSCTTRHLQALVELGLVARTRRGKRVMFRLRSEDPAIGGLVGWAIGRRRRRPATRARSAGPATAPDRLQVAKLETPVEPARDPAEHQRVTEERSEEEEDEDRQRPYDELEDFLL